MLQGINIKSSWDRLTNMSKDYRNGDTRTSWKIHGIRCLIGRVCWRDFGEDLWRASFPLPVLVEPNSRVLVLGNLLWGDRGCISEPWLSRAVRNTHRNSLPGTIFSEPRRVLEGDSLPGGRARWLF